MKKYKAVLEIEDDEEIIDAKVTYFYSSNGMNYKATERMELKEENENARNKTYEDGLNEAWEAARKIISTDKCDEEMNKAFGDDFYYEGAMKVLTKYSVEEVVEKLKEHEIIKIGDEVIDKNGWGIKGVVTKISERCISIVENEGSVSRLKKEDFNKTGRHYPQIEEMLKQIQEEEE